MIGEWIDALKAHRSGSLKLAELAHRAFNAPDFDYEGLRTALAAEGYDCPEKPTLSKYKDAYDFWVAKRDTDADKLQRLGLSKAYTLAKFLETSSDDPDTWLERAIGMPRSKLTELISSQPLQEPRRSIGMPESVYDAFIDATQRLYAVNGFTGETPLAAIEFCTGWLTQAPPEVLQELWRVLHGEDD